MKGLVAAAFLAAAAMAEVAPWLPEIDLPREGTYIYQDPWTEILYEVPVYMTPDGAVTTQDPEFDSVLEKDPAYANFRETLGVTIGLGNQLADIIRDLNEMHEVEEPPPDDDGNKSYTGRKGELTSPLKKAVDDAVDKAVKAHGCNCPQNLEAFVTDIVTNTPAYIDESMTNMWATTEYVTNAVNAAMESMTNEVAQTEAVMNVMKRYISLLVSVTNQLDSVADLTNRVNAVEETIGSATNDLWDAIDELALDQETGCACESVIITVEEGDVDPGGDGGSSGGGGHCGCDLSPYLRKEDLLEAFLNTELLANAYKDWLNSFQDGPPPINPPDPVDAVIMAANNGGTLR